MHSSRTTCDCLRHRSTRIVHIVALSFAVMATPASALSVGPAVSLGVNAIDRASRDLIEVRAGVHRGGAAVGPRGGAVVHRGGAAVGPRGGAAVRRTAVVGPRGNV